MLRHHRELPIGPQFIRQLLLLLLCCITLVACGASDNAQPARIRIAMIHFAPEPGRLDANRLRIEQGTRLAAEKGANWVLTPELAVSGYAFADVIGTDWIQPQPDVWMNSYAFLVRTLGLTAFIGTPEKDPVTGKLHNSLVVSGRDGLVIGRHRKIVVIPGPLEGWSTPGGSPMPVQVGSLSVGMLVCADAYPPDYAAVLKSRGAEFLVSSAAWFPGEMGPNGAWEDRSRETGLPLVVNNRTGTEPGMDFTSAESVVNQNGERVATYASPLPAIILIDYLPQERIFDSATVQYLLF